MKSVTMILIIVIASYLTVSIFAPDIRFTNWWGTSTKLGAISHLGIALCFWVIAMTFPGFFEVKFPLAWYYLALLGLLISAVGYWIDSS